MKIEKVNIEPKISKYDYANNVIKDCVAQGVVVYRQGCNPPRLIGNKE